MNPRWRRAGSIALLAIGLVPLLGATLTLYLRERILDAERFADSAVASLDDDDVDRYVAAQVTGRVIDRVDPDLVTFKPLIESAVGSLLQTDAMRAAVRRGVLVAHGAVFNRDLDAAAVTVGNAGALIRPLLERADPELARSVPRDLDVEIADFADQPLLVDTAQAGDDIDRWAGILPGLAILMIGGSIVLAPHRRRAAMRAGIAIVALAAASVVALEVARAALLDRIPGGDRGAAGAVWDELLGDLATWELAVAALGVILATAAAAVLRSFDLHEPLRRAWARVAGEPATGSGRALWALGLGAAGAALVAAPERVLEAGVVILGVYLLARAVSALVGAVAAWRGWTPERLAVADAAAASDTIDARRSLAIGAAIVAVLALAVGVGLSLALREDDRSGPAARTGKCNGERHLCERRLNEVAFLATHNSYAGTGYPGFLFPEQEGTIGSQLDAGVRGLWIDTYYGTPGRRVYTRTDRIDPALNAMLRQELGPRFEQAAAAARAEIAQPPPDAPQRIYLCHGFCELGAVEAAGAFREIVRFLERNPEEVLIIDLEDYTTPKNTVALLERTGLADYVYRGPDGPPWPTLREMIDSGQRVLLVIEHRTDGAPRWYRPAYDTIFQETPFQFKTPAQMSCAQGRGHPSNSLFLVNNWIDTDPTPRPSNAAVVNAYDFLLERAQRCQRRRGRFPNVLNVDFYGEGEPGRVVATLNSRR